MHLYMGSVHSQQWEASPFHSWTRRLALCSAFLRLAWKQCKLVQMKGQCSWPSAADAKCNKDCGEMTHLGDAAFWGKNRKAFLVIADLSHSLCIEGVICCRNSLTKAAISFSAFWGIVPGNCIAGTMNLPNRMVELTENSNSLASIKSGFLPLTDVWFCGCAKLKQKSNCQVLSQLRIDSPFGKKPFSRSCGSTENSPHLFFLLFIN